MFLKKFYLLMALIFIEPKTIGNNKTTTDDRSLRIGSSGVCILLRFGRDGENTDYYEMVMVGLSLHRLYRNLQFILLSRI